MKKLLFFVLVFAFHVMAQAADDFSTLEERMSGKEFKEAGLGKLTEAELSALNDWLRRHSVGTLENVAARPVSGSAGVYTSSAPAKDMRGFANQPKGGKDDEVIRSTIVGTFDGWDKKGTLFKLANGMIWQQTEKDVFKVDTVENPEVIIEKRFMGKWKLSMVGQKPRVSVKRIQ